MNETNTEQTKTDFNKFLDEHQPIQKTTNITTAGKVLFKDIEQVNDKWNEYPNPDGTTRNVHSYTITIKGKQYRCPTSVMDNIKEMRKQGIEKNLGTLTGFIVTSTGTGKDTNYNILPDFTK